MVFLLRGQLGHRRCARLGGVERAEGVSHRWGNKNLNTPAEQARRAEYDSAPYRAKRKQNRALINAGQANCWRCGGWIPPGTGHTGHPYLLPEHTTCNLSDGARKGAAVRNAAAKKATQAFTRITR